LKLSALMFSGWTVSTYDNGETPASHHWRLAVISKGLRCILLTSQRFSNAFTVLFR
jgi:hypothetical protein